MTNSLIYTVQPIIFINIEKGWEKISVKLSSMPAISTSNPSKLKPKDIFILPGKEGKKLHNHLNINPMEQPLLLRKHLLSMLEPLWKMAEFKKKM